MIIQKIYFLKKWKGVFGHLSIFFFSILLSSCFNEIPYPFDMENREVILTGFNNNNKPLKIQLNYGAMVLDTAQNPINNANVYLYKNEQIIDTLEFVTEIIDNETVSHYKSTHYPECENNYSIKAITSDGKNVTTQDYIPNEPIVSNVQIFENQFTIINDIGNEYNYAKLKFTLTDILPITNFYEIKVLIDFIDIDFQKNIPCSIDEKYISDTEILNDPYLFNTSGLLFSDHFFNQNSKDFELYFRYSQNWFQNHPYKYIVEINNISENYYHYIKQISNYNPDNEPFNLFSNIGGGKGVFALFSTKRIEITP